MLNILGTDMEGKKLLSSGYNVHSLGPYLMKIYKTYCKGKFCFRASLLLTVSFYQVGRDGTLLFIQKLE